MYAESKLRMIFAELAPTPYRWGRSARAASITALGAGIMAAMQISNPLGLTLLVSFALPEAAFPLSRGLGFLCAAAILQTTALAVVGTLADVPMIHLSVFILLSLVTSYLIYSVPTLGRLWVWIQVPVITAFYMVMFVPRELGWDNAQMFAGLAIAVGLLLVFNNLVWARPAQMVLADSITATLERSRRRLADLFAIAINQASADVDRPVASKLGHHVDLLAAAIAGGGNPARRGNLIASVMSAQRIHNQVERFAAEVLRAPSAAIDPAAAEELRKIASAIDRRFDIFVAELRRRIANPERGERAAAETEPLGAASNAALADQLQRAEQEYPELSAITSSIELFLPLLESDPLELPIDEGESEADVSAVPHKPSRFLVRYSVRHTIALTIAFVVGLWDHNQALHAAIWLLILGGPPSHGATVRKFTMRALGSSAAIVLAALGTVIVAPNYTSFGPYMVVIFIGTLLTTYIGEGGGILSYMAIGGTAFVIAYSGPGPRAEVLGSIWSVWGISLGMIIRAAVSLVWRERPSRTLAEQFQAPLEALIEMTPASNHTVNRSSRMQAETAMAGSIQTMLQIASDAQLEGRSAGIDAKNLVDALDTLGRLAFALANLSRLTNEDQVGGDRVAVTDALRIRFVEWLVNLRDQTESGTVSRAPLRMMIAKAGVAALEPVALAKDTGPQPVSATIVLEHKILSLTLTLERQLTTISLNR